MKRNTLISIICTLLIVLWVYAAGSKLSEYRIFTDQLKRQPLPAWSIHILAWALPLMEIITALLIYFQRTRLAGLIISLVLMVSFTLYVVLALSGRFGETPRSCSGIISGLRWKGHLVFNIVFTVLSIAGVYLQMHSDKPLVKHKAIII